MFDITNVLQNAGPDKLNTYTVQQDQQVYSNYVEGFFF